MKDYELMAELSAIAGILSGCWLGMGVFFGIALVCISKAHRAK